MAQSTVNFCRRNDFFDHSEKEDNYYRNPNRVVELRGNHDRGDRSRNRFNSLSRVSSDVGGRRDGFSVAELSSRHEVGSRMGRTKILKVEDSSLMRCNKKRKFPPVPCNVVEKEVKVSTRNKVVSVCAVLSQPKLQGGVFSDEGVDKHMNVDRSRSLQCSIVGSHDVNLSDETTVLESSACSSFLAGGQCGKSGQEVDQPEGVEVVCSWNVATSRWASESVSPRDKCFFNNETTPKRCKITSPMVSPSRTVLESKISSPESGEFRLEGSGGDKAESSVTDDTDFFIGSGNDDFMKIDENHGANQSDLDYEDDSDSHLTRGQVLSPKRSVNMLQACRSVFEYEKLNKINEGAYGVVYRARDKKTGEIVALKKMKIKTEIDGFPMTALREINILLSFHHPSIVDVREVVVDDFGGIFMVMELMEHDLQQLIKVRKQSFSVSEVKGLVVQLLEGIQHLHDNWVLHRDLKTSNLLLNEKGELKICDFGLSRRYGSPSKPYTQLVVTLWYRAPELLLGTKQYSTAIDMWSVGCIMAELLAKQPLFQGKTELDQLDKIFRILGTPNETIWPGVANLPGFKANFVKQPYSLLRRKFPVTSFTGSTVLSESGFDLLSKLLTYDPERRITAEAALNHDWFHEAPLPKYKGSMSLSPSPHAQDR